MYLTYRPPLCGTSDYSRGTEKKREVSRISTIFYSPCPIVCPLNSDVAFYVHIFSSFMSCVRSRTVLFCSEQDQCYLKMYIGAASWPPCALHFFPYAHIYILYIYTYILRFLLSSIPRFPVDFATSLFQASFFLCQAPIS